jgi:hypothetical protein
MDRTAFIFIGLLCCAAFSCAAIIHVPMDVPTIQAGLDSLQNGDTVLVMEGTYAEALVAPPLHFVLRGNISQDSIVDSRPILSVSSLPRADTLTCLRLGSGSSSLIADFIIRGGQMGVRSGSDSVELRNCKLDSSRWGYYQSWIGQNNSTRIFFQHCDFSSQSMLGIYVIDYPVTALSCTFALGHGYSLVSAGPRSQFVNCYFGSSDGSPPGGHGLAVVGDGSLVSGCQFGPATLVNGYPLYIAQTVENAAVFGNVFSHNLVGSGVLLVKVMNEHAFEIRQNTFEDNNLLTDSAACIQVDRDGQNEPAWGGVITGNDFMDCRGQSEGASAVMADGDIIISENSFRESFADEAGLPAIHVSRGDSSTIHGNYFYQTGFALLSTATELDAEQNWWGHNSGPYHEILNPLGQGDTIRGAPVDFEPWIIDTTNDAASSPLPLVYQFAAFPNPFNSEITIEFVTTKREQIRLEIFALTGRLVETISDEELEIGIHRRIWNARDYASGIFFARLSAVGSAQRGWIHKLVLLK